MVLERKQGFKFTVIIRLLVLVLEEELVPLLFVVPVLVLALVLVPLLVLLPLLVVLLVLLGAE